MLVPRNVTGISAGTSMHCGSNEYCCATSRTTTLPSASTAVPRLDSTNSPEMCSVRGSIVSTRDGGIEAQWTPVKIIIATSTTMMSATTMRPPPLGRDGDRFRGVRPGLAHWTAPRGRNTKK